MCPCEIAPLVPAYIHTDEQKLTKAEPTMKPVLVEKSTYVLPVGVPPEYRAHVSADANSPVTVIATARVSAGKLEDDLIITTKGGELWGEIGLSEVVIDEIRYIARNPVSSTGTLIVF